MSGRPARRLAENAVGFMGTLYNSLAGQAPAYSIAAGAALVMGSAYAASPLAMLLALLGVLAVAYSVYALARRYQHVASFYAYVANALSPRLGYLNGVIYTVFYSIIGLGSIAVAFAYLGSEGIYAVTGYLMNPLYLLPVPIVAALIPAVMGIRPSVRIEAALTTIEVAILVLFVALTVRAHIGSLSTIPFSPSGTFAQSPAGALLALSGGLVFAVTYFMGFEVSTQISEEAKDPRTTVPRGTMLATLAMGILYVLVTYAIVVNLGYGKGAISGFVSAAEGAGPAPNPIYYMVREYMGYPGMALFTVSVLFSVFGSYLATLNATSRMLYGMARDGLLPAWLSAVHERFRSPTAAIYLGVTLSAVAAACGYAVAYAGGYTGQLGATYGAMQFTYAIDSLYYVLSLILVAVASLRVVGHAGKALAVASVVLLAITFYYSVQYPSLLYVIAASVALTLFMEYAILGHAHRHGRSSASVALGPAPAPPPSTPEDQERP